MPRLVSIVLSSSCIVLQWFISIIVVVLVVVVVVVVVGVPLVKGGGGGDGDGDDKGGVHGHDDKPFIRRTPPDVIIHRKWNIYNATSHRCNIERINIHDIDQRFGTRDIPPLVANPFILTTTTTTTSQQQQQQQQQHRNHIIQSMTARDTIIQNFPVNGSVTLSSMNAYSDHRRTIPLHQYLTESWMTRESFASYSDNNHNNNHHYHHHYHQRSNESWYLFGETYTTGTVFWKK
jgi:hypothetical protein